MIFLFFYSHTSRKTEKNTLRSNSKVKPEKCKLTKQRAIYMILLNHLHRFITVTDSLLITLKAYKLCYTGREKHGMNTTHY